MFTEENISLIIIAHNQAEHVRLTLGEICNSGYLPGEVVIIDDRSTDNLPKIFKNFPKLKIKYFYKKSGEGFEAGKCRNIGYKLATSKIILFLDGDCIPSKDIIKQHKVSHNKFKTFPIAVIGQRISIRLKKITKETFKVYKKIADLENQDSRFLRYNIFNPTNDYERLGYNDIVTRPCMWSCNLSLQKESCKRVNRLLKKIKENSVGKEIFDSDFDGTWGWEDTFLGICLLYTGTVIVTNRKAIVYHIEHKHSNYSHGNDALFYDKLEKINKFREKLEYKLD